MPGVRSLLCLLAFVCALGVAARAACAADAKATTALEAGPFARADAVLDVQVLDVRGVKAPQVVRARVLGTMKGPVTSGSQVSILVVGERPTLDASRPSVPYFQKGKRERYVVFLGRGRGRHAWQLQTLYDASGTTGREKIAAVAAVAAWAKISDARTKVRTTLSGLLQMLKGQGRWLRPHAARELAYLAQLQPEAFDRRTVGQLTRIAALGGDEDQRFWLRRVTQILRQRSAAQGKAAAGDPWREGFEAAPNSDDRRLLLGRLLQGGAEGFAEHGWWAWVRLEPSSRLWLLDALAGARATWAVARLRTLYGSADSGEVREGIVRTVGLLGGEGDVAWLAARLRSVPMRRAALIALARVRTATARRHLQAARSAAPAAEGQWIAYLLSPAFEAAERKAGRR